MDKYQLTKKVGAGGYGQVFAAEEKKTKTKVAIKKIATGNFEEGVHVTTIKEIKLLQELSHLHIIQLIDVSFLCSWNMKRKVELKK